MNPRTTTILAVVALALGAFVYFHEIEGEVTRQAARDDANRVHPGLEAGGILAIELVTGDDVPARFERREGEWRVVSPVEGKASATALDAIASALADLPKEGAVTRTGDGGEGDARDLTAFGLGPSARVVRFETEGQTLGLRIGGSTPVGGHLYVARLADDAVAYVERYRLNALDRTLADLRDRRILGFASGDVRTLRLRWPVTAAEAGEGAAFVEIALARDGEGAWQMGVPIEGPADSEVVRDLLSDLAYLRADDFVDEPTPAVTAALAETAFAFHWTLEGDHLERSVRIGGEALGARVFEGPDGRLYTIASERLEDFPRRLVAYRFKRLSEFEVAAARGLRIELRPEAGPPADASEQAVVVEATLGETGWTSDGGKLDPDRGSDLVRALSSLSAVDILADEMGEAERASLGLVPPRARIEIRGEASDEAPGPLLADLRIGRFDPGRGLLVMRADAPAIFVIDSAEADDLPISIEGFEAGFAVSDEGTAPEDEAPDADPLEGVEIP